MMTLSVAALNRLDWAIGLLDDILRTCGRWTVADLKFESRVVGRLALEGIPEGVDLKLAAPIGPSKSREGWMLEIEVVAPTPDACSEAFEATKRAIAKAVGNE
jgi:hypothetical protein